VALESATGSQKEGQAVTAFTESVVEEAALAWLESAGWRIAHGADIAPDMPAAERQNYGEVVLAQRLRDALARLNPGLPAEALEDAFRKLTRPEGAELIQRNRALHRLLVDGVTVEYRDRDGAIRGAQARAIDFADPANNDWLALNRFSVTENKHTRRPAVVLFVNGLAVAVLELKNAADEDATIWSAFQQLQTYKAEVPALFATNALLVISDGVEARVGTLTAGREWFKPWRTISGEVLADARMPELQVVTEGLLAPRRFLDLIRDFIVFEDDSGARVVKKMAGYRQFHAVQVAVGETLRAAELARADRVVEAAEAPESDSARDVFRRTAGYVRRTPGGVGGGSREVCPYPDRRLDRCNRYGYNRRVIRSFKHEGLERFFLSGAKSGIQPEQAERLRLILAQLHASVAPGDMALPGPRLHRLKGDRKGTWSVSVGGNWRVTFSFDGKDAVDVDYEDYH
jgi:plasmid maintenance system killer protein